MKLTHLVLCLMATLAGDVLAQANTSSAIRQSDVIYGRKFGVALTMEVFTPARHNGIGIVWAVSSSGRSSREQTLQESFEKRISPLLDRGFTVFAAIHGSAPVFSVQDQVDDVRRAVRFVRHRATEFGIDGERLGIGGSSAGGLLALVVALDGQGGNRTAEDPVDRISSRVQAVGCFFPPTDLIDFGAPSVTVVDRMKAEGGNVDPSFQFYELDAQTGARRMLTARPDVLQRLRDVSPVTHVTPGDPPTILIHGDQDRAVPIQQSRSLVERLTESEVAARLVVREGVGHAYAGWEADAALIAEWFEEHLLDVR
jgi:acetyl esterase/lipase